jgi:hypothetical protein
MVYSHQYQENTCTCINKPDISVQNKLYIILTILETIWYTFSNTAQRYVRHNEHTILYYGYTCKIHEFAQITKIYF